MSSKITIIACWVIFFMFAGSVYAYLQNKGTEDKVDQETENSTLNQSDLEDIKSGSSDLLKDDKSTLIPPWSENNSEQELIQQCPDAWIENRMPTVTNDLNGSAPVRQYFIFKGERFEAAEVDISWVVDNCEIVKPSIVY